MLQNWSSSAESAHANTEASVSGHRLYSDGKSIEFVDEWDENGTWNIFVRREAGREFRINLTKQEWKENNVKKIGSKVKGKRRVM